MAVRGDLQDLDLLSLLQMTCEEGGDAQISLEHGISHATLYVKGGQIVHAENGNHHGVEVVYQVLGWRDGSFALSRNTPLPPAKTIHTDWNSLLLEGLRRLDEMDGTDEVLPSVAGQKTLLVVGDDAATLAAVESALVSYKSEFTILSATHQHEAVALLDKDTPDLLLVAVNASPATDAALVTYLLERRVLVPIVMVVPHSADPLPATGTLNPVVFLHQPLDAPALVAALWAQLARSASGDPIGLTLYALCEWLRVAKHSCLIRVKNADAEGMLAFVDGQLMNAVYGQRVGEPALLTIFGWAHITIEFADVVAKVKPLIQRPLAAILANPSAETLPLPLDLGDAPRMVGVTAPLTATRDSHRTSSLPATSAFVPDAAARSTNGASPVVATVASPPSATRPLTVADGADTALAPADADPVTAPVPVVTTDTPVSVETSLPIHMNRDTVHPSDMETSMATSTDTRIDKALQDVMQINGALGAALVDITSGMALGKVGNTGLDLDIAAAGNSEVVKAKMNVMKDLGIRGEIEDILITLQTQYHLIRPLGSDTSLFLYLVLNKDTANLALARRQLSKAEAGLTV